MLIVACVVWARPSVTTDDGIGREFTYDWTTGHRPRKAVVRLHPYGTPAKCEFAGRFDRARDLVELSVPTDCLKDPDSVRVSINSVVWEQDRRQTVAWDDAFEDGRQSHDELGVWSPVLRAAS